jgi:hypothetical protein
MNAVELQQPRYQFFQLFLIMYIDPDIPFEKAVFCFDGQGIDIELQLPGNKIGDLIDDAHIIHSHDADTGEEGYLLVFGPFGLDDPMSIIGHQLGGIGAIGPMDGKAFTDGTKPKTSSPGMGLQQLARV